MKRILKVFSVFVGTIALLGSAAFFAPISPLADDDDFASLSTRELYSDKITHIDMPYRLYVPKNYDASKEYQLIVYLHGAGEIGNDNSMQIKNNMLFETLVSDEYIDEHPCIVVAPQSDQWWGGSQLVTVMSILDDISSKYNIDSERQVLIGYSMGGGAVWDMLFLYPNYFDAAVPIASVSTSGSWESIKNIPIWIFHATDDSTVSVDSSREMYNAMLSVGGNVFMTESPNGGHSQNFIAFNKTALYNWLFSEDFKLPSRKTENGLTSDEDDFPMTAVIVSAAAAVVVIGGAVSAAVVIKRRRAKKIFTDSDGGM